MNNTALRAGLLSASGACLATTEAERRPQMRQHRTRWKMQGMIIQWGMEG